MEQNPELLERLKTLEHQKLELQQRADLSAEEISQGAKKIRREIRRLKERLGLTDSEKPKASSGTSDQEPAEYKPRHTKKYENHVLSEGELAAYIVTLREDLARNGIIEKEKLQVGDHTKAFDMVICAERSTPVSGMIVKFKQRWNDNVPTWFHLASNSMRKDCILHFGPIPEGMVNQT